MDWHQKPYWFRRKWYGRGRYPVTWQGWTVVIFFVIVAIAWGVSLPDSQAQMDSYTLREQLGMVLPFVVMVIGLILICYLKGEKPKRQWGKPTQERK